jgi:hypothetical protein
MHDPDGERWNAVPRRGTSFLTGLDRSEFLSHSQEQCHVLDRPLG